VAGLLARLNPAWAAALGLVSMAANILGRCVDWVCKTQDEFEADTQKKTEGQQNLDHNVQVLQDKTAVLGQEVSALRDEREQFRQQAAEANVALNDQVNAESMKRETGDCLGNLRGMLSNVETLAQQAKAEVDVSKCELETAVEAQRRADSNVSEAKSKCENARRELREATQDLGTKQSETKALERKLQSMDKQREGLTADIHAICLDRKAMQTRRDDLLQEKIVLESKDANLHKRLDNMQRNLHERMSEVAALSKEQKDANGQLKRLEMDSQAWHRRKIEAEDALGVCQQHLDEVLCKADIQRRVVGELKEDVRVMEAQRRAEEQDLTEQNRKMDELKSGLRDVEGTLNQMQESLNQESRRVAEERQGIAAVQARVQMHENHLATAQAQCTDDNDYVWTHTDPCLQRQHA